MAFITILSEYKSDQSVFLCVYRFVSAYLRDKIRLYSYFSLSYSPLPCRNSMSNGGQGEAAGRKASLKASLILASILANS